ncbi:MAG: choice-of-anchor tandem repeat GloVer-containing protein [Candidatus Cybelea sp.]
MATPTVNSNQTAPALFAAQPLGSIAEGVAMRPPFGPRGGFPWVLRGAQPSLLRGERSAPFRQIRPSVSEGERWPEKVLYAFSGPDGAYPNPVITGPNGVLYGTTSYGGAYGSQCYALGCGTVFQLTPGNGPSAWTETVLYSFTGGADGASPARVTLGANGVLYGATYAGGANNLGTVFALTPPPSGQTNWTESVLYSFTGGADGGYPYAAITDLRGSLYSTTSSFGTLNAGVAFRLTPPAPGQTNWTETVIHAFGAAGDGSSPTAGFTLAGTTLLSTTSAGGGCRLFGPGCGTVYQLTPKGRGNREWRETILHRFTGFDGLFPNWEPTLGQNGQLYATASNGGGGCGGFGCGTTIEMTPPVTHRRTWDSHIIFYFGQKGVAYVGALIADETGNLYGEAQSGGSLGDGVIFELSPRGHRLWTETIVHRFSGSNGSGPYGELTIGAKGHIYGVTYAGGTSCACGVVFQLKP